MDEWAWSVLKGDVLPHGKVKEIMDKHPASRIEDEIEDLDDVLEEASKGRDARKSKKSVADWPPPKIPVFIDNQAAITILSKETRGRNRHRGAN